MKKIIVKLLKLKLCKCSEEKWEEEFEVKNCILTFLNSLNRIRELYLQLNSWTKKFKVKIQCRKGEIRITKIGREK